VRSRRLVAVAGCGVASLGLTLAAGCGGSSITGGLGTSTSTPRKPAPSSSVTAPPVRHRRPTTTTTTTTTTITTIPPSTTLAPTTTAAPTTTTATTTTTTTTLPPYVPPSKPPPAPPPIPQPTAARPLVILEVGDSLGEDLGIGMGNVLGSDRYVTVLQQAVGYTGLANVAYYDWRPHLEALLRQYHPAAVVVMLGGNDGQSFYDGSQYVGWGSAVWHRVYSERVGQMMDEAVAAGAHVLWVGMPIMRDAGLSTEMAQQNSIYAQQAAIHPGVTYFSSWDVFATSTGRYSDYLPNSAGVEVLVRDPDGVHFATDGETRIAQAIIPAMQSAWGINLHA
jgi:hypothetical protein